MQAAVYIINAIDGTPASVFVVVGVATHHVERWQYGLASIVLVGGYDRVPYDPVTKHSLGGACIHASSARYFIKDIAIVINACHDVDLLL